MQVETAGETTVWKLTSTKAKAPLQMREPMGKVSRGKTGKSFVDPPTPAHCTSSGTLRMRSRIHPEEEPKSQEAREPGEPSQRARERPGARPGEPGSQGPRNQEARARDESI
jgi:hypothetical protein